MDTKMENLFDDSLSKIYAFSNLNEEHIIKDIESYVELKDRNDYSEQTRMIRRNATEAFFKLYKAVALMAMERSLQPWILLFLSFGFVSEKCVSDQNIDKLCKCMRESASSDESVFTFFEWLEHIYDGETVPSINSFSLDYPNYLKDEYKNGRITEEEMKLYSEDRVRMVEFEIDGFLKSASKTLAQSITTFCPILTDDDLVSPVERTFIRKEEAKKAVNDVEEKDYSLFFRDYLFSDPKIGVEKAYIKTRVTPNIILFPFCGIRGIMWQETEGPNRQTPARFVLPVLLEGDLKAEAIKLCGAYRWEFCKRVEGYGWMDITNPSLTSEYYDYITNYKKEKDLTLEAKEKVKADYQKANKNIRTLFVSEYYYFINNESENGIKLNKISRRILFKYCPLSASVVEKIKNNSLFLPMIERKRIQQENNRKSYRALLLKLKTDKIPEVLEKYKEYLELE